MHDINQVHSTQLLFTHLLLRVSLQLAVSMKWQKYGGVAWFGTSNNTYIYVIIGC